MDALALSPEDAPARDVTVSRAQPGPSILYVDHSSKIAGAELVLLDIVQGSAPGSSVFLFEDGPLRAELEKLRIGVIRSNKVGDLSRIRRDSGLTRALPAMWRLVLTVAEIARHARARDLIYANSQKAFVLSALARPFAGRRLLWHLHDILDRSHFGGAQRRLVIFLANTLAATVVVPSQAAANAFVAAGGRPGLIKIVPNGVDLAPVTETRTELRSRLGLPEGFVFGVFSRLAPWKGQHLAIQAAALLPDAHCVIVGDAQFGEHEYARGLRALAEEAGIAARVSFLGHRSDVAQVMSAVEVVVHPSVSPEPFGRTLVEAMKLRIPVVSFNAGAAPDILDAGRCGTLVDETSGAALAAALDWVRAHPAEIARSVEAAAIRADAAYSAQVMRASVRAIAAKLAA